VARGGLGFGSALRRPRAIVPAPDPWKQCKLALLTPVSGLTTNPCGTDAGQRRPALECKLTPAHEGDLGTELQVDCNWARRNREGVSLIVRVRCPDPGLRQREGTPTAPGGDYGRRTEGQPVLAPMSNLIGRLVTDSSGSLSRGLRPSRSGSFLVTTFTF
jgi:hypothetical protein